MTKLPLSVAAMLLASSAAFAGSDHGANNSNQPVATVDTKVTTGPSQASVQDIITRHNNDGLWGR